MPRASNLWLGKSSSFMLSSFRHSGVNGLCSTAPARSIDSSGCGLVGLKFVGNECDTSAPLAEYL